MAAPCDGYEQAARRPLGVWKGGEGLRLKTRPLYAGTSVAAKLVEALARALQALERNPAIGSPTLGKMLGLEGLRTWRVDGFALTYWYFERDDHLDVVRLVGQRQEQSDFEI